MKYKRALILFTHIFVVPIYASEAANAQEKESAAPNLTITIAPDVPTDISYSPESPTPASLSLEILFAKAQELSPSTITGGADMTLKSALAANEKRIQVAQAIFDKLIKLSLEKNTQVQEFKKLLEEAKTAHENSTPEKIEKKAFAKSRSLMNKTVELQQKLKNLLEKAAHEQVPQTPRNSSQKKSFF